MPRSVVNHIFVSHASRDKVPLVRPLVEALLAEGEPVWLDRPGAGEGNFGFDQAFIARHDIDHLQSGHPWSTSIRAALREAGAVLGCLSQALLEDREVLLGELTVADATGKLVTCLLDDTDFAVLGRRKWGLLDLSRYHCHVLDPGLLREVLDRFSGALPRLEVLEPPLRTEWEKVRNLIADLNRVRVEPRPMRPQDLERILPLLREIPIGPIFNIRDLPEPVLFALGDHANTSERARALLRQANALVAAATTDERLRPRLRIREGALPPVGSTSGDNYWSQVFREAGLIARRMVAAVILTPVAEWAMEQSGTTGDARALLDRLRSTN